MAHNDTSFHAPVVLAEARAERARRRVRAGGRVPSDFMPCDYGLPPENDHPVEGGGIPWRAVALIGFASLICLGLVVQGVYSLLVTP